MFVEWRCIQCAVVCIFVHTGRVVSEACNTCFNGPRTRLYMGNTGSDTCRYCRHTRSYSGSKSIVQQSRSTSSIVILVYIV